MAFSDNLKMFRKEKGLTQKQLADIVGVAQGNIAHYEMGTKAPTIMIGVKLAHALDTTCEILVEGKESAKSENETGE